MELDLSKLNKLTTYDFIDKSEEKQPSNLAVEPFEEGKACKYTSKNLNAIENDLELVEATRKLQVFAD